MIFGGAPSFSCPAKLHKDDLSTRKHLLFIPALHLELRQQKPRAPAPQLCSPCADNDHQHPSPWDKRGSEVSTGSDTLQSCLFLGVLPLHFSQRSGPVLFGPVLRLMVIPLSPPWRQVRVNIMPPGIDSSSKSTATQSRGWRLPSDIPSNIYVYPAMQAPYSPLLAAQPPSALGCFCILDSPIPWVHDIG